VKRSYEPDPKLGAKKGNAPRRIVDPKAKGPEDSCPLCDDGKPIPARSRGHHVVARGQGGDDVPANLVRLCGDGVRGCHGDVEGHRGDARARLRVYLEAERADTLAYLDGKIPHAGRAWLEKAYA